MDLRAAYRATLWAPIVPALLIGPVAARAVDRLEAWGIADTVAALGYVGATGLIGVPYMVFAALVTNWSRTASTGQLQLALNLAPVAFTGLLFVIWAVIARIFVGASMHWYGFVSTIWQPLLVLLVYGYACVALGHAVIAILRQRGWLEAAV